MLDLTKPIQTRAGWPARVLATDLHNSMGQPGVVVITHPNGYEYVETMLSNGRQWGDIERSTDIINVPPVVEPKFFNMGHAFSNLPAAKNRGNEYDVLEVTFTDGELTNMVMHPS
jgi:hypothetical protein